MQTLFARQTLPQFFSDVGHERVQQTQSMFEHREQSGPGLRACGAFHFRRNVSFCKLDIPVAEIVPEEVIQGLHCSMKLVGIDCGIEISCGVVQSRNDPAIVKRSAWSENLRLNCSAFRVEQAKPRGIPDLVRKVAIRLDLLLIPTCVSTANVRAPE